MCSAPPTGAWSWSGNQEPRMSTAIDTERHDRATPPPRRSSRLAMSPTASLSANLVDDVRELLRFPFMVHALEAGTIVAVLAAVAGWYMVMRRQSFAGHTLSVMAFPGATGAALVGLPISLGYYIACAGAALLMGRSGGPSWRVGTRLE